MARSHSKKYGTRPAMFQPCEKTHDHEGHRWRFSEKWPKGVFWWCPGYNRAEAAEGAEETMRALKKSYKRDKGDRARARRSREKGFEL